MVKKRSGNGDLPVNSGMNERSVTDREKLDDLLIDLASRTKAVEQTIGLNLSDEAYVDALRGVQDMATKVVEEADRVS